jgi:Delta14-sterol reductase
MRWISGYLALLTALLGIVLRDFLPLLPTAAAALRLPSLRVVTALLGYLVSLAVLGAVLPGRAVRGAPLKGGAARAAGKGGCLVYKCNGLLITGVVVVAAVYAVWSGEVSGSWIVERYGELFVGANLFAVGLSVWLFFVGRARRVKNWLDERGVVEDFVMGAELNPFVMGVDVKFFSYRPSMTGWLLINLSFLAKQYEVQGFVTGRMLLYQVLTAWYIWDYFVHEAKMVHTWDIIAEHFGLMLVWGDYVFIPFGFSVQLFFLLDDVRPMAYAEAAAIVAVFAAGFTIFRGANSQKHRFKTDPTASIWGKPPITVGGGRLLASGFWGVARHMNYTGDLLLALSYCLPCGFRSGSLPYFYLIYLLLLTVHREKRDDERCSAKYKSVWDEYCLRVPYRMVPFVY